MLPFICRSTVIPKRFRHAISRMPKMARYWGLVLGLSFVLGFLGLGVFDLRVNNSCCGELLVKNTG